MPNPSGYPENSEQYRYVSLNLPKRPLKQSGVRGWLRVAMTVAAIAASSLIGVAYAAAADDAHVARTLSATDTARMHQVKRPGSLIVEEGIATGTLPGTVKAYVNLGATVIAKFTLYPKGGGSITGSGSGELKGRPAEPSFGGHYTVVAGTGRYAHAHGSGGLYGVLNRKTLSLTVSTTGKLSY